MTDDPQFRANLIEGMTKFQNARSQAFWQDMFSLVRGRTTELMNFDDVRDRLRLREESYKGLQEVPLDRIVGSVGRYRDFTGTFLPRRSKMQERWSRVYAQATSMTGLPPIELYKIDDVYFVRDGNHRVSVARQLGSKTIQAHVTELSTPVDLWPGMTPDELDDAASYAVFLSETGLERTRAHHQSLKLSEASRYGDLLWNIRVHQRIMEQRDSQSFTFEQAAAQWYDNIYRPAVTLIRKYGILDQIPNRTEADLFLWFIDNLRELRERYGAQRQQGRDTLNDGIADFLRERNIEPEDDILKTEDTAVLSRKYIDRALQAGRELFDQEQQGNGHQPIEPDNE